MVITPSIIQKIEQRISAEVYRHSTQQAPRTVPLPKPKPAAESGTSVPEGDRLDAAAHVALPYVGAAVVGFGGAPYMFYGLNAELWEIFTVTGILSATLFAAVAAVRYAARHLVQQSVAGA